MKIIKVDATASTNTFLKELCQFEVVEDYTVVVTDKQLNGRGQQGAFWESEYNKNLTFSLLVKGGGLDISDQIMISKLVSLVIFDFVKTKLKVDVKIKWPNDILAVNKKICGILIENTVKKTKITQSIIGIGLNINQTVFELAPNATSFKLISGKIFNLEVTLNELLLALKSAFENFKVNEFDSYNQQYLQCLYKYEQPSMFYQGDHLFMGKIIGVNQQGNLLIELEDQSVKTFGLKEIRFALDI